ncbi:MAG: hypothetical protein WBF45_14590 [Acidobacteriaceae bacterium]
MSYSSISSNRVEFLEGVATPAFLQKSKQPFDADIDDAFLSFFAGCAMNDVCYPTRAFSNDRSVRDTSVRYFQPARQAKVRHLVHRYRFRAWDNASDGQIAA